MVKIERSFPAPDSLAEEAKKADSKYDDGIMDCCKCDPEKYLSFYLIDNDVVVKVSDTKDEIQTRTAQLVKEVFSMKNMGMRIYKSDARLRLLQKEMTILFKQLEKLHSNSNSKVTLRAVSSLLRRESAFAAFKRCYVREHAGDYPELQKYILL